MTQIDMAKIRRESMRWFVLLTLNNARPYGATEHMVLQVVQSEYPDATTPELRRELDYLDDRKLIIVTKQPDGRWRCELTALGTDVAEYTVDCHPGIARPERYW